MAEVARRLDSDCVVNLQGDEPLIEPAAVETLIRLVDETDADMATLAAPLQSVEQWRNPNCVKVVCDAAGQALYFSRSPIPFVRDGQPDFALRPPHSCNISAFTPIAGDFLLTLADLPPHPLEQLEKLEQLACSPTADASRSASSHRVTPGVDDYDDYRQFVAAWRQNPQGRTA